jgi:cysteinyl-tRNA synthetase
MNSLIDDSVKLWAEYRARGMYPAADMLRRMLQAHQVTVSVQRGGAVTWRYL